MIYEQLDLYYIEEHGNDIDHLAPCSLGISWLFYPLPTS